MVTEKHVKSAAMLAEVTIRSFGPEVGFMMALLIGMRMPLKYPDMAPDMTEVAAAIIAAAVDETGEDAVSAADDVLAETHEFISK